MDRGHGEKFSRKRQLAISALLENPTVKDAAAASGLADSTLWRWMKELSFRTAYGEAKRQVVENSISRLQKIAGEAAGVLGSIMRDESSPPNTRVAAAKIVLEMSLRGVETADILSRLDMLETALLNRR
jgi:uncharacterized protein (UPF0147 family)